MNTRYDPILTEVHAVKQRLAREANLGVRLLGKRFRDAEKRFACHFVEPSGNDKEERPTTSPQA